MTGRAATGGTPEVADPLVRVTSRLNSVGALATAIVGLCSTMFACSSDNIKRNDAFISALSAQEKQWQGLYDQFFAAISVKDDTELRDKRLLSICQFSDRQVPDFSEHRLGYVWILDDEKRQKAASEQLNKLKLGLRTALATEGVGSPASVDCILNRQAEAAADDSKVRAREVPDAPQGGAKVTKSELSETVSQVRTSQTVIARAKVEKRLPDTTLTLSVGARDGYDIDIFWCEGPDAARFRQSAQLVADLLTDDSRSKRKLGDLYAIGRVRLRPLSIENQLSGTYPARGFEVRGDSYEDKILALLTTRLNSQPRVGPFIPFVSGSDTKWYLSVFVCS
jgi:hypothetical protein